MTDLPKDLPDSRTLLLTRRGRLLTITLNRPDVLNAFAATMHIEIIAALRFAATDPGSDVIVLTGAGRAFSAGGDLERMEECIANPVEFDRDAADELASVGSHRILPRLLFYFGRCFNCSFIALTALRCSCERTASDSYAMPGSIRACAMRLSSRLIVILVQRIA